MQLNRRSSFYINLDPAAESFEHTPDLDIRELISLEDVMEEMGLGPNGGLIYCFEFLMENLDFLTEAEDTSEDGTTSDTALELVNLRTRLVDIEGTDNNEAGIGGEVTDRNWDAFDDVFIHGINVVLQLGGYWDNRGRFGDSTCWYILGIPRRIVARMLESTTYP